MDANEKVYMLLKQHGGHLTSKVARTNNVDNKILQHMARRGEIERVTHGLYVGVDVFPDPYFVAQHRCPKGIFSHETSLFFHDLSDRTPFQLMMTIPSGWNSKLLTDDDMLFFYSSPKRMVLGACEVETPNGMEVRTYDAERTLCDCLKHIEKLDRDLVLTALKRYVKSGERDSAKLLEYAAALKIRDMVYRYLEVLA